MTSQIETIKEAIEKELSESQERAKTHFAGLFKAFFEENPDCQAVRWNQYSPYFNDGEPCTFSVHDPEFRFSDTKDEDSEREDGFEYIWGSETDRERACKNLSSILHGLSDHLEITFGDGYEITIARDGTMTVDEYAHD